MAQTSNDRYTFIEITDEEVYSASPSDFEERARALETQGVTHVIYGCCHFRWSYWPWLDVIDRALGLMTEALHRRGIKAIEHHSSSLMFTEGCPHADWDLFREKEKRGLFPGFCEYNRSFDAVIDGVRLSSMWQVDGKTGLAGSDAGYKTHVMCYNNPDYRRIYFDYLEHLYRDLKIDGIMTDDVEIYSHDYCTCEHCRKLFHRETGLTLPDKDGWREFTKRFEDPLYVAWLKFRQRTTKRFQDDVKRHFESLGYSMLRPNYVFRCLVSNTSCYPFEACADQWTVIFAENSYGIKTGYPIFAAEGIHRRALAKRAGVEVMSMFYPHLDEEYYFCRALCWSWGQRYMGDDFTERTARLEKPLIRFENEHRDLLFGGSIREDLAVWFSADTRDLCRESPRHHAARIAAGAVGDHPEPIRSKLIFQYGFLSWLQACWFSGLQTDMVFENDPPEELDRRKVILAPYTALLSPENAGKLADYVRRGGTLVTVGNFGEFDGNGGIREGFPPEFGTDAVPVPVFDTEPGRIVFDDGEVIENCRLDYAFENVPRDQVTAVDQKGRIAALKKDLGKGRMICLAPGLTGKAVQDGILFFHLAGYAPGKPVEADAPEYAAGEQMNTAGRFLKKILPPPRASVSCPGYHIIPYCAESGGARVVHLINLTDTLVKESRRITDYEPLDYFKTDPKRIISPVEITLNGEDADGAVLYSPEIASPVTLKAEKKNGALRLSVPAGTFSGYALIELK